MKSLLTLSALLFSISAMATEPNEGAKEQAEDVQATYTKPTTEQTATVSRAVIRAKKLKKKKHPKKDH